MILPRRILDQLIWFTLNLATESFCSLLPSSGRHAKTANCSSSISFSPTIKWRGFFHQYPWFSCDFFAPVVNDGARISRIFQKPSKRPVHIHGIVADRKNSYRRGVSPQREISGKMSIRKPNKHFMVPSGARWIQSGVSWYFYWCCRVFKRAGTRKSTWLVPA